MPLFRYQGDTTKPYYIELGWQGPSYRNNLVQLRLTEKNDDNSFKIVEEIGQFKHSPKTAKEGYKLNSSKVGNIEIKFVTKFLIISEIQVIVNGNLVKGGEVINYRDIGMVSKH